jgi:hypothetical protein
LRRSRERSRKQQRSAKREAPIKARADEIRAERAAKKAEERRAAEEYADGLRIKADLKFEAELKRVFFAANAGATEADYQNARDDLRRAAMVSRAEHAEADRVKRLRDALRSW